MVDAAQLPLACTQARTAAVPSRESPRVLVFSPHPDDEVITGALPLRLLRQDGWRIINVAVTLGSNPSRRQSRWQELKACCDIIGFELLSPRDGGLEGITPATRLAQPEFWSEAVGAIAALLREHNPSLVIFPHEQDFNGTHIGTHRLVMDAVRSLGTSFNCHLLETEFWAPMSTPNLMIECPPEDLGDLLAALSHHQGEVQRNPYHVRLPAWMVDNVRRGAEILGGQGAAAPTLSFATLYRQSRWEQGAQHLHPGSGRILLASEHPSTLFPLQPSQSRPDSAV